MKKISRNNHPKIIVAMSGGVDSSVAAFLLKEQGFQVAGVFMKFWEPRINAEFTRPNFALAKFGRASAEPRGMENLCCSEEAEEAARAVAQKLKIPFKVLDFSRQFKKEVVDYFLSEHKIGRTPNPCVVCNKKIKFGLLFRYAQKMKADFLASGHYARIKVKSQKSKVKTASQNSKYEYKIFAAEDKTKDQSYFLWGLNQEKLAKMIFPLGRMKKDQVRQLAKKRRLPYFELESFDLCFARQGAESFIKKYLKLKPGEIRNLNGEIFGRHDGLPLYTIGQRKRIPVSNGPWRVVGKDEKKNILYVSNDENDLYSKELLAEKINWLAGRAPKFPLKVFVKIRYKSEAAEADICLPTTGYRLPPERNKKTADNQQLTIKFKKPQFAITPGQSAVFYSKKGEMLGGGAIACRS